MEYIIAFYFAGVLLAMFKLWLPSYKIIKLVDPNNPLIASPLMSTLVVFILFTLFFPLIMFALLFDDKAIKFIEHFSRGAIGDYDKKR
tara:strand:- start:235 stop:498 length:264 start_codon:yes stop_codon:yes gene_type:complete